VLSLDRRTAQSSWLPLPQLDSWGCPELSQYALIVKDRPFVKTTITRDGPELWTFRLYPSNGVALVRLMDDPWQATVTVPPLFA
jgi:hypothetical protein